MTRGPLAASFGTSVAIQGLNVVTGVLLARGLGPADRGALAAVILWPAVITTIGSLGLLDSIVFYSAKARHRAGSIFGTAAVIGAVQAPLLMAIGALVVNFALAGFGAEARHAAFLNLAYVPLFLAMAYMMNALQGSGRIGTYQALRSLQIAVTVVGIVALSASGFLTVTSAVVVYLCSYTLTAVAAGAVLLRTMAEPIAPDRATSSHLLRYGLASHTSTVSSMLNERLDQLVIALLLGPATLGLYVIAVTMTSATTIIASAITTVALPQLSALPESPERTRLAVGYVRTAVLASALVTMPLIAFAPAAIDLFFGAAYLPAARVAQLLLVSVFVFSVGRVIATVLKALNRPLQTGLADAASLVVTIVGLSILLPLFGIVGAGLASFAAYAVSTGVLLRYAARALAVPAQSMLGFRMRRVEIVVPPSTNAP